MNIGVIGCGYWGPNLIRNFHAIPDCNMSICSDLSVSNLERMNTLFPGIGITTNYQDILDDDDISGVAIAVPVHLHHRLAMDALEAGKHVIVEKPLAASSQQCREMIEAAEKRNLVLMVGHTFEYNPAVNKMREIIKSGEIGKTLYVRSARLNLGLYQQDINVMWDLAPHDISILLYLLEKEPTQISAQGKGHYFEEIEDVASATLDFDDGTVAFIQVSWLDPYKVRQMTLVGTKKMLVYDDTHPNEKIKLFDKGIDAPPHYDSFAEFQFAYRYGDIYSPRIEEREPVRVECEHFIECIRESKKPLSDGYSGLRVVSILEAICQSIKVDGTPVKLKKQNGIPAAANKKEQSLFAPNYNIIKPVST